jgi:methylamine---glutamate N-methyltransferase subunit A
MCGIVGLLVKTPALRAQLGQLMASTLNGTTEPGPDAAGLAVFGNAVGESQRKLSLYSGCTDASDDFNWNALLETLNDAIEVNARVEAKGNHAVLTVNGNVRAVKAWLMEHLPKLFLLSTGRSIDLYKDIGSPAEVAQRYDFAKLSDSHLVGHTRMATESSVTPDRAHPFTAGADFCLVHNGSLSNAHGVRRMLEPQGIRFGTDNDTEAACRFLEWRLREGDELLVALQKGFEELDGFYTFLMGYLDQTRADSRPVRVQAGGSRRERRLRRNRVGVPFSRRPAGHQERQGFRTDTRGDVCMESVIFDLEKSSVRELNQYLHGDANKLTGQQVTDSSPIRHCRHADQAASQNQGCRKPIRLTVGNVFRRAVGLRDAGLA